MIRCLISALLFAVLVWTLVNIHEHAVAYHLEHESENLGSRGFSHDLEELRPKR